MSDEITANLRRLSDSIDPDGPTLYSEAADELERLRAQVERLTAAKGELVAALQGAVSVLDQNRDEWERGLEALAEHGDQP